VPQNGFWEGTMKLPRRQFVHLAVGAAALPAVSRIAAAQIIYPTRRVTIIVPYPAGGGADAVARVMAERMRSFLGQPVIVENVAGASGSIGLGRLARATPDGYTLGVGGWTTDVSNGLIYALPYDVANDFEPIALTVHFYYIVVARKAVPANNLKELIAWLKSNPDKATAGTTGVGSPGHLAGILLQNITGTRFAQVPYRGNTFAMQDLLAGHIDFYWPI
jgi:tripartite-type tricarboxylate transporter receptor subunit TctC